MNEIVVDIVCPLYNAEKHFDILNQSIKSQKNVIVKNLVYLLTESDDDTKNILDLQLINYKLIKKSDFSHSLSREDAIRNLCSSNIVVMLSQDIYFSDDYTIYNLVLPIVENEAQFVFGRQSSKFGGIEKYIREINYPDEPYIYSKDDVEKYQLKTFFSSDAFAAYNRDVYIKLNGYDNQKMPLNEDMYYAHKIIDSGYKIGYISNSVVYHSHKYKLKELYNRYFQVGLFFGQYPIFNQYKSNSTGFKLALKVFWIALKRFDIISIIILPFNMLARFLGKKNGEKYYIKRGIQS